MTGRIRPFVAFCSIAPAGECDRKFAHQSWRLDGNRQGDIASHSERDVDRDPATVELDHRPIGVVTLAPEFSAIVGAFLARGFINVSLVDSGARRLITRPAARDESCCEHNERWQLQGFHCCPS
jgi:hypothetical protein